MDLVFENTTLLSVSFRPTMSMISVRCHLFMVDAWRIQARVYCNVRDALRSVVAWLFDGFVSIPPSPSRKIVTTQWLSKVLNRTVTSIKKVGLDKNRGFVGGRLVLQVETVDTDSSATLQASSLVLKTSQPQISTRLAGLGVIREAMYYNSKYAVQPMEMGRIPKTYYSHGSRWLGEMVVLMENLQEPNSTPEIKSVGVNQLMGNQIWGVAKDTLTTVNKLELLKAMYFHAAEVHAQLWMDKSLLKESWMRNANWFHGGDRHYWEFSMEAARQGWEKIRTNTSALKYPEGFVEVLDASFANSSWEKLQEHLKTAPFTLTHGDFHASNMIVQLKESALSKSSADELLEGLKIFDWSEVGPWEPATDLAQTIVSDLPKELFDQVEDVLRAYHVRLQELGVKDYSWEDCRRRFGESGMERWIWVLGAMSSLFDITSTNLGQYFVDQMEAFRQQFCPHDKHFVLKTCGYILPARE